MHCNPDGECFYFSFRFVNYEVSRSAADSKISCFIVPILSLTISDDMFFQQLCVVEEYAFILSVLLSPSTKAMIHNSDVIMSLMASQVTDVWIVCSAIWPGADQRKHQSTVSLAFVSKLKIKHHYTWHEIYHISGEIFNKSVPSLVPAACNLVVQQRLEAYTKAPH